MPLIYNISDLDSMCDYVKAAAALPEFCLMLAGREAQDGLYFRGNLGGRESNFMLQVANNVCDTPEKYAQSGVKANAQCPCCNVKAESVDEMCDLRKGQCF